MDGITRGGSFVRLPADALCCTRSNWWCWGCTQEAVRAGADGSAGPAVQVQRAPPAAGTNIAMPPGADTRQLTQCFDTVQAKLCMLFTGAADAAAGTGGGVLKPSRMAMAAAPSAACFAGKRNTCVYCSSSFQSFTGCMAVNSGVEHADALRAQQAVLAELEGLCTGPIEQKSWRIAKRILSAMDGVEDTLGGLEN